MLTSVEPRGFVWGIPSLFMLRSWFHLDNTPFYLQDGGQSERSSGRGYSHRTRVRGSGNRTSSGAAKRKIILPIFQREHIRRKQILFSIERKERRTPYSQRAGFDANRLPPASTKLTQRRNILLTGKTRFQAQYAEELSKASETSKVCQRKATAHFVSIRSGAIWVFFPPEFKNDSPTAPLP